MTTALRVALLSAPQRPPAALLDWFRNGEKGDIWLPHFTRYAFQDAAMTIPAAVGMPVLKMVGLANGIVATFANVTLQRNAAGLLYLAVNGTSSTGQTPAIDFTGTDKMTVVAGVRKATDAAIGVLLELSANSGGANPGSFMLTTGGQASAGAKYGNVLQGSSTIYSDTPASYVAPHTAVLTQQNDIIQTTPATEQILRVNGVAVTLTTVGANAGNGNFGNHALYFFARNAASAFMSGDFYGGIVCGASRNAGQIADVERIMARYTGVNL